MKIISLGLAAVAVVIATIALVAVLSLPQPQQTKEDMVPGAAGLTSSTQGDYTIKGGTLNVVTANSATSTVIGGCWQFYATSTLTAHRFLASTTPGIMYSSYGLCPNL